MPEGRMVLAIIEGDAYVLDAEGNLRVVDKVLGTEKAMLGLTGMDVFAANLSAPAIFAASREGHVYCIRALRAAHLGPEALRRAAGR
jgi:hypothetical protein